MKHTTLGVQLGVLLSCSAAEAGMEGVSFVPHWKPQHVASKAMPFCDDPSTATEEPNYSPNYTNTRCDTYRTDRAPLGAGHVYVVIAQAGPEGVSAASFGVAYDGSAGQGIDPAHVTWTPCANGLSFPNSDGTHGDFPQPGGGLRITWNLPDGCQKEIIGAYGVHAVVGVFYVYAYSDALLRLTPNNNLPQGPEAAVADCAGTLTDLVYLYGPTLVQFQLGSVGFGTMCGFNPCPLHHSCGTVPAAPTTWGRMKTRYEDN